MKYLILCILAITLKNVLSESALDKNNEILSREKRVSVDGVESSNSNPRRFDSANGVARDFPIRMPYLSPNNTQGLNMSAYNCMLYMEGITVVAINPGKGTTGGQKAVFALINGTIDPKTQKLVNQWNLDDGKTPSQVICNVQFADALHKTIKNGSEAEFTVDLALNSGGVVAYDGENIKGYIVNDLTFRMHFTVPSLDNWYLDRVEMLKLSIAPGTYLDKNIAVTDFQNNTADFTYLNSTMRGYYGYSYGCSATPAVWFHTKDTPPVSIGLQFVNFQVDTYNLYIQNDTSKPGYGVTFKHMVNDCVPTFSVGSWMSIISSVVLAAVFLFGFLMLNSIQTMDKLDDPKMKQIVINTKE